jgi:hypothetical protein
MAPEVACRNARCFGPEVATPGPRSFEGCRRDGHASLVTGAPRDTRLCRCRGVGLAGPVWADLDRSDGLLFMPPWLALSQVECAALTCPESGRRPGWTSGILAPNINLGGGPPTGWASA